MNPPTIPVFDLGNVMIGWDPRALYRKIFPGDPERMEWFLTHVCSPAWNLEQDRGRSFADAVELLVPQFPEYADAIRAYHLRWSETVVGEIAGTVEIFRALKKRGRAVYAITNWNQEKFNETRPRFDFLSEFDGIVVSGDEGLLKPDRAIFDLFLRRYDLQAADCLFIDDSLHNVEGARAAGMHAVRFESPARLAADLARHGLGG
jgi:HAD superfamily hydrolase (TIGR01509 family)